MSTAMATQMRNAVASLGDPDCCETESDNPVNLTSGVVTIGPVADVTVSPVVGSIGIAFTRTHTSRSHDTLDLGISSGPLGISWRHSYESRIEMVELGFVTYPLWHREDGRAIRFNATPGTLRSTRSRAWL